MQTILGLPHQFWSRTVVDDTGYETPCLTWTGSKSHEGYSRIYHASRTRLAYRVAYEIQIGPVPKGLELDHLCRNRSCVNWTHLEAVTHAENMRRQQQPPPNGQKTHCPKGHPYSGDNLIVRKCGRRRCRACNDAHNRDYYVDVTAPRRAIGGTR